MRWSSLIGVGALLATSQALVACGDSDSNGDNTGGGGSGGSSTSGAGGMNKGGSTSGGAGANTGGGGTSAGTFSMAGTAGTDVAGGEGGMATGGTGGVPECTKDLDCFDDFNVCTDEKCMDGKCQHVNNTADCTDNNPCTDDKCDGGTCKSTNNTIACDDKNDCTDNDMCTGGACKGTNNTKDCDDLTTCTTGDKCTNGACAGTRDLNLCPACNTADNLIKNCDFTMMLDNWSTNIDFGGMSTQMVVNEHDVVSIANGGDGTNRWNVQPRQEMVALEQGFKYEMGLVAGSNKDHQVAVWMVQNGAPYQAYSKGNGPRGEFMLDLTAQMKPFNFSFLMTYPDDPAAKFEIDAGGDAANYPSDLYFDDVYLRKVKCALPADCDDGNACTDDACDAVSGKCTWTNNTAACDDDKNDCTVDACAAGVCGHTAKADTTACDSDGQACSIEACSMGVCKVTDDSACSCSVDKDCDDKDPCTDDTCNGGIGAGGAGAGGASGGGVCVHSNNTASCVDTDVCTVSDMCAAGKCAPGTNVCFNCATAENMISNCGFDTDLTGWSYYNETADTQTVQNGMMAINLTASGAQPYTVQPYQPGLQLTKGVHYLVKFNAYDSAGARDATVSITENGATNNYASYSTPQTIHLTKEMQLFTFEFDMAVDPPPANEQVKFEFDLGGPGQNPILPNTVFIDNVYLAPKL